MLVEREVDAKLLLECITSYLVLCTTSKLDPNYDQVWNLVDFDRQQLSDKQDVKRIETEA